MEEVWKATGEVVRERLSSPVLTPFAIAWVGWNYKFFVILLSSVGIPKCFEMISEIYPTWIVRLTTGFLFPLFTAAFIMFVLPMIEEFVLKMTLRRQRDILDLRRDHTNSTRLSLAESQALRADMIRQENEHKEAFERASIALGEAVRFEKLAQGQLEVARTELTSDPLFANEQEKKLLMHYLQSTVPGDALAIRDIPADLRGSFPALLQKGFIRQKFERAFDETEQGEEEELDDKAADPESLRFAITRAGAIRIGGAAPLEVIAKRR